MKMLLILELDEGVEGKGKLMAAGGQHWVSAVVEWTKVLTKQYVELT